MTTFHDKCIKWEQNLTSKSLHASVLTACICAPDKLQPGRYLTLSGLAILFYLALSNSPLPFSEGCKSRHKLPSVDLILCLNHAMAPVHQHSPQTTLAASCSPGLPSSAADTMQNFTTNQFISDFAVCPLTSPKSINYNSSFLSTPFNGLFLQSVLYNMHQLHTCRPRSRQH